MNYNPFYNPTAANTIQVTVQIYMDILYSRKPVCRICTVENLFIAQVGLRIQKCHALPLSLINLLTTATE